MSATGDPPRPHLVAAAHIKSRVVVFGRPRPNLVTGLLGMAFHDWIEPCEERSHPPQPTPPRHSGSHPAPLRRRPCLVSGCPLPFSPAGSTPPRMRSPLPHSPAVVAPAPSGVTYHHVGPTPSAVALAPLPYPVCGRPPRPPPPPWWPSCCDRGGVSAAGEGGDRGGAGPVGEG